MCVSNNHEVLFSKIVFNRECEVWCGWHNGVFPRVAVELVNTEHTLFILHNGIE